MDGLSRLFLDGAPPSAPPSATAAAVGRGAHGYLEYPRVADVLRSLGAAVAQLQAARGAGGKVVLLLDEPDLLLATAAADRDGMTSTALGDVIHELREVSPHADLPPTEEGEGEESNDRIPMGCVLSAFYAWMYSHENGNLRG